MSKTSTRSTTSITAVRVLSAATASGKILASTTWLPGRGNRTSNRCVAMPPAGISGMRSPGLACPSSRNSIGTSRAGRLEWLRTATSNGTSTPAAGTPPTISSRSIVRFWASLSAQSTNRNSVPATDRRRSNSAVSSADLHVAARKSLTSHTTLAAPVAAALPLAAAVNAAWGPTSVAEGASVASASCTC